ncbi:hypothetical protein Acsp01_47800 [Actinoplanes sp. NBRC 101535]|nr:hypothetical protein Acsp01_47800 [Actinoplanes sp. NBRC 101535]
MLDLACGLTSDYAACAKDGARHLMSGQGAKPIRVVISGALDASIHHTRGGVVITGALDAPIHHTRGGVVITGVLDARSHHARSGVVTSGALGA